MNRFNAMCMTCHKKNNTSHIHKLQQIEQLVRHKIRKDDCVNYHHIHFMWGIHSHCPYGIHCTNLEHNDGTANRIARELEPYLVTIAISDDARLYHEILQLLRGEFSSVYRLVEDIHNGRYNSYIKEK